MYSPYLAELRCNQLYTNVDPDICTFHHILLYGEPIKIALAKIKIKHNYAWNWNKCSKQIEKYTFILEDNTMSVKLKSLDYIFENFIIFQNIWQNKYRKEVLIAHYLSKNFQYAVFTHICTFLILYNVISINVNRYLRYIKLCHYCLK